MTLGYPMPGRTDHPGEVIIGPFITVRPIYDRAGQQVGVTQDHPRQTGEPGFGSGTRGSVCSGILYFDTEAGRAAAGPGGEVWQVVSLDPLTLSPSVLCPICGHHGTIVDGRWVPASG